MMSIPYSVCCSECGDRVEVTGRVLDNDGDLFIDVEPCKTCLKEAAEAAREGAGS